MFICFSVGELSFTIEVGQLIVKVGPNVFSIQQFASSAVELFMCIFIVVFFRRLHAKRVKIMQGDKESEALKCDDEMVKANKEQEDDETMDKDGNDDGNENENENEIKMDEIHS